MSDSPARDVLTLQAAHQPGKLAVVEDRPTPDGVVSIRWTFSELESRANRLSNVFLDFGVEPGERVIWCGLNSPGVVCGMHAGRKVGATMVPLNYRLTPEEAAYVVDNSDAALVYCDAEYGDLFAGIRQDLPKVRDVMVFDGPVPDGFLDADTLVGRASDSAPPPSGLGARSRTMTYTSGTTGKPKGAVRRGMGDPDQVRRLVAFIGYERDDVYLTTGPLYHSGPGGFMGIAHNLGNTVVLQRKFDAEHWLKLVHEHGVTTSFSAPTPIRMVTQLPPDVKARYRTSSLKRFVANAAPWSWALKEAYLADFPEDSLFEVYGSTEMGVNTVLRPEDQRRKRGSCGVPAPGVELALFDESGARITTPDTPGELFARSGTMFDAYHKAEEKYEADRRGDFHTVGDVAYFDEEGFYYICDRKSDMIISGGMNIYPAEIEAALDRHPQVADVAVIGIPSEEWGEGVHAMIVPRPGASLDEAGLLEFARAHLAGYKVPRSLSLTEEIPRNGSGKIMKRELRAPFWEGQERGVS